ncbi:hypothetical protein [Calycomorphotria hydatis]|uniref:Uncharacterized protein n=1 Tax=Calycomorphotria hydatis TaxID=2528027 RepID=A0A517TB29_9PLAN|nr:hypothetical protein [Calycomorphotria hydatis]QDT65577.1 hypothetical protein V22_28320 [Calycomorphotria hydatis]
MNPLSDNLQPATKLGETTIKRPNHLEPTEKPLHTQFLHVLLGSAFASALLMGLYGLGVVVALISAFVLLPIFASSLDGPDKVTTRTATLGRWFAMFFVIQSTAMAGLLIVGCCCAVGITIGYNAGNVHKSIELMILFHLLALILGPTTIYWVSRLWTKLVMSESEEHFQ